VSSIKALETPRLLLRPLQLEDAEQTQALFPQWGIVRYHAMSQHVAASGWAHHGSARA
jgi:hypothetical protein